MSEWTTVCQYQDLTPNTGICALFEKEHVAIFYCKRSEQLYAVSNVDPIAKVSVLSRGIMASLQDQMYVASPLYKQHFNLKTGECLESPEHTLKVYQIRNENDQIQLKQAV
ncbi:nitrite reductase small subunit NirD [Psychromonas sp. PT13]|uniref:nitrite reductase small subunit NirD n=1 Tax=Psychromonas sp. PT13 TaxID=3439547 RepID=UPI003EB94DEB